MRGGAVYGPVRRGLARYGKERAVAFGSPLSLPDADQSAGAMRDAGASPQALQQAMRAFAVGPGAVSGEIGASMPLPIAN